MKQEMIQTIKKMSNLLYSYAHYLCYYDIAHGLIAKPHLIMLSWLFSNEISHSNKNIHVEQYMFP